MKFYFFYIKKTCGFANHRFSHMICCQNSIRVGPVTCPCCCDTVQCDWSCPLSHCSYTLCQECFQSEKTRQGADALFQCPLCRRYIESVPVVFCHKWKEYASVFGQKVHAVADERKRGVKHLVDRCVKNIQIAHCCKWCMSIFICLFLGLCFVGTSITVTVFAGRAVFLVVHGIHEQFFPHCMVYSVLCVLLFVASSILGLIYIFCLFVCLSCVEICRNIKF